MRLSVALLPVGLLLLTCRQCTHQHQDGRHKPGRDEHSGARQAPLPHQAGPSNSLR